MDKKELKECLEAVDGVRITEISNETWEAETENALIKIIFVDAFRTEIERTTYNGCTYNINVSNYNAIVKIFNIFC